MVVLVLPVVMVMMMFMLVLILIMMMVMVLMLVLIMVVMLMLMVMVMVMMFMLVMIVIIVVVVMMMVFRLLGLVLGADALHQLVRQRHLLHGRQNGLAVQLIPGGGDDGGVRVLLPQQRHGGLQLFGADLLGAAEDDGAGSLDLVVVELAEVLHVHLHLGGIGHGDKAVQLHLRHVLHGVLHRQNHVRQLAHARRLNEDAVGAELLLHIHQRPPEVAHQGAADAARGHLADLHAGILQKAAVDADLAELVLNEYQLLALVGLRQHLFDERGLARAQKSGHNINFSHKMRFLSDFQMTFVS